MLNELIKNNIDQIIAICEESNVASLYAFGSITDAHKFTDSSDIDLLVSFKTDEISIEEYTASYFSLMYNLEDLLKRDIDLTTQRSLSNPYFIEELEATKVLIYNALEKVNG